MDISLSAFLQIGTIKHKAAYTSLRALLSEISPTLTEVLLGHPQRCYGRSLPSAAKVIFGSISQRIKNILNLNYFVLPKKCREIAW